MGLGTTEIPLLTLCGSSSLIPPTNSDFFFFLSSSLSPRQMLLLFLCSPMRNSLSSIFSGSCPRIPCNTPCRLWTLQYSLLCCHDQPALLDNGTEEKNMTWAEQSMTENPQIENNLISVPGGFGCLFPPVLTHSLSFEWVPDVYVKVIVASQYQASWQRRGQRGHPAHDARVLVGDELLVSSQVVQLTGGVIRSSYHCITIREEL